MLISAFIFTAMQNKKISRCFLLALVFASMTAPTQADPLALHGTGEGLTLGQFDPNWSVELPDGSPFGPAISAQDPNGGWIAPTPPNTWVSVEVSAPVPAGIYKYSTSFSIDPGFDPATASISGNWWADEPNTPNAILLNGIQVSDFNGAFWFDIDSANALFAINSGFVSGLNTLTFLVENTGGPGGTLIQNLSGSVRPSGVPDAGASALLLGIGLLGISVFRRRI
jgi:hypothetical protein